MGRFRVVTGKPACWRCAETPLLPLGWTATPTATATTDGSHQRSGSTETTRTAADCLRGTTERTLGGVFASQTANMARQRWVPGRHHLRGTPVATPVQVGLHAGPRGAGIAQRVVRVVGGALARRTRAGQTLLLWQSAGRARHGIGTCVVPGDCSAAGRCTISRTAPLSAQHEALFAQLLEPLFSGGL